MSFYAEETSSPTMFHPVFLTYSFFGVRINDNELDKTKNFERNWWPYQKKRFVNCEVERSIVNL